VSSKRWTIKYPITVKQARVLRPAAQRSRNNVDEPRQHVPRASARKYPGNFLGQSLSNQNNPPTKLPPRPRSPSPPQRRQKCQVNVPFVYFVSCPSFTSTDRGERLLNSYCFSSSAVQKQNHGPLPAPRTLPSNRTCDFSRATAKLPAAEISTAPNCRAIKPLSMSGIAPPRLHASSPFESGFPRAHFGLSRRKKNWSITAKSYVARIKRFSRLFQSIRRQQSPLFLLHLRSSASSDRNRPNTAAFGSPLQ